MKSSYHGHYHLVVEDNFWSSAGLCLGKTEALVYTWVDSELKLKSLWINYFSLALQGHCVSALFNLLGVSSRVPCLRRCLFVCSPSSSARGSSAAEWWWTPVSPHLYVCPASGEPANSHRYISINWMIPKNTTSTTFCTENYLQGHKYRYRVTPMNSNTNKWLPFQFYNLSWHICQTI